MVATEGRPDFNAMANNIRALRQVAEAIRGRLQAVQVAPGEHAIDTARLLGGALADLDTAYDSLAAAASRLLEIPKS